MDVNANLRYIQRNIEEACLKSHRNLNDITIIGVTKYVTIERAKEAINAGITNLGENRAEGFENKYAAIGNRAAWHFIGSLQSNKVKDVVDKADVIHSLDRMSLAKEINKRASSPKDCFVQINVSGEEAKHGLVPEEALPFIEKLEEMENIRIIGLMTMAPYIEEKERLRNIFRALANLRNTIQMQKISNAPCHYLSMGMSNDYKIAVEEGATHIRIGSSLVGSEQ